MPLEKSEIRVPFGGGLDTKTDQKQVIPGQLLELKNGVFSDLKQITKRNGFLTPFSLLTVASNVLDGGFAVYRRGGELLITARQVNSSLVVSQEDGNRMFTHDSNANEWQDIGTREPLSLDITHVAEPIHQQVIPDVAVDNAQEYACYGWIKLPHPADAGAVRRPHISVIDLSNNAKILDDEPLLDLGESGDAQGIHNVGFSDRFHTWTTQPAATLLIYSAETMLDTLSAPGNLVARKVDGHLDHYWDVCKATRTGVSAGECAVVAYKEEEDGFLNVSWFDQDANHIDTNTIAEVVTGPVTVFEAYDEETATNKVTVAYIGTTGWLRVKVYNSDATQYTAPTTVQAGPPATGEFPIDAVRNITGCADPAANRYAANRSYMRLYVECDTGNNMRYEVFVYQFQIEFDGNNPYRFNRMPHCGLASKAWAHDSKARVWTVHDSWGPLHEDPEDRYQMSLQNTFFLKSSQGEDTTNHDEKYRTDARLFAGSAHGLSWAGANNGYEASLSGVPVLADGSYLFAAAKRTNILFTAASPVGQQAIVGVATTFGEVAQPSTELGPCIQTGGGFVGHADGRFQELGFHLFPESVFYTYGLGAGGGVDWVYLVVYEWTDREGQRHQSAPSCGCPTDDATDAKEVTVSVSSLCEGDYDRGNDIRCTLYRTLDGSPGGPFYRLPIPSQELNDREAMYIEMVDLPYSDATIANYETLYTTGGVVENICPPASSIMNVRQDRVLLVPDEDKTNIWFSKLKRHEVGVSFSDLFTKRVSDGGDITGLVTMDTREIVFKESEIRAFSGTGPIDTGVGTFSEDYQITSDVGCISRASIVWTDKGIMFKSHKGIYMLGRNLQVSYVGAPVEEYNTQTVLKAELVENKNQVRFLLEDQNMLVYDYFVNQWSVFEAPQAGESFVPWETVDSAIWQDNYVMIRTDGLVYREGVTWIDTAAANYIPLDLTTSWIKLTGLQGYQRVWWISLLGEVYTECTINYEIYYDYIDTNPQVGSFVINAAFAADPPAQFRLKPRYGNGKCQAFKIRLYDEEAAVPAGIQKGYSISDVMVTIGKKSGVMRQGTLKTK
ncbi:MAG: hypothetical protein JRE40_07610 [Deltaproteobacteria bacterium]|nr:hypothetical protein [Deltaproteobacteria bacterium]